MTVLAFPNLIYRASNMPRITCMTCGGTMPLTLIEPASKGYDVRSYECSKCNIVEQFVTEI